MNNTKEQFSNSSDLSKELINAIMDAFAAHSAMSKQALVRFRAGAQRLEGYLAGACKAL